MLDLLWRAVVVCSATLKLGKNFAAHILFMLSPRHTSIWGSDFFEPWCVNNRLNLRGFSAVRWNHNWVYCWRQLDFISWNISKGILQFFAFSPVLNYLDRLPIRHPRQWVLLSFINTLCFPTVFSFLMCHASTLGPLCLQLLTNQKVI